MGKYFGTDGFRGEVGRGLDAAKAFRIGRFLGRCAGGGGHRPRVAIGKDTRRSSYTLEYALAAGLTASGADAHILHVTTTPSVSFVTRTEGFDLGIMISASHNPFYDNGIKLFDSEGEKMADETIARLEAYLDSDEQLPFATGEGIGVVVDAVASRNRYIGHLISLSSVSYRGYRVGLDTANGAAWAMARSVFDALGASTSVIHNAPNGVNINENAGSTHIERLRALVLERGLDVGFAFDGDADRCLAVDHLGHVVDGDAILYVAACYMKERGLLEGNTVVTTKMSNLGLSRALAAEGIACEVTEVGDKYVYERMAQKGYTLGGEQSGHIIFSRLERTGDGLVTALTLMEILCNTGLSLYELARGYVPYPQLLRNVRVRDRAAVLADADVTTAVAAARDALGESGRLLVRPSGTEPMIRLLAEGENASVLEEVLHTVVQAIEKGGWTV